MLAMFFFKCKFVKKLSLTFFISFFFLLGRIQLRMDEIVHLWENLVTASGQKGSKLREAAQQQQFNRTVEDIELWLSEVEGQLLSEDYGKVILVIISQ